jgi:predicted transcriptional regulator
MLEQLFGSKTRTQLLRAFLQNPEAPFFVRELTRLIEAHINAVRHELKNLEKIGLVEQTSGGSNASGQKKHYRLNRASVLFPELKALFMKSRVLLEKDLVKRVQSVGKISYFALTGRFMGSEDAATDLFVVGEIDRKKLSGLIRQFEIAFGHEINYTVLDTEEMRYRMDVMDRFLYSVLDQPKMVVIDKVFGLTPVTARAI